MTHHIGIVAGALLLVAGPLAAQQAPTWVAKASEPTDVSAPVGGTAPVIVAPAVAQQWDYLYRFIDQVEFVLCLEGHVANGVVHVDGFRLANMIEAGATTVRYEPCETPGYVGTAHNHPPASGDPPACYRSIPDRKSFNDDKKAVVDVVICGQDKWVWILKDGRVGGTVPAQAPGGGTP